MSIVKQTITENQINLGGKLEEIQGKYFSCYNFNNNFNSELLEMSPDFFYFTVTKDDYIKARSRNMLFNWPYSDESGSLGKRLARTRLAMKLSVLKATRELADYREEQFIPNNQDFAAHIYSFGDISDDLEVADKTEEIQTKISLPIEEKIEVIVV